MCDDVTMTEKYKQGTPTSNTHVTENFQMNIFHKLESINDIIPSLCTFRMYFEFAKQILPKFVLSGPIDSSLALI